MAAASGEAMRSRWASLTAPVPLNLSPQPDMESIDAPYKSRLFNFLNRQVLLGLDRLGRAARHVQVAAIWSAQILVYPIYLTVQTGRLLGQKVERKTRETLHKLSPFRDAAEPTAENPSLPAAPVEATAADAPIRNVVAAIAPWAREQLLAVRGLEIEERSTSAALATGGEAQMQSASKPVTAIQGVASHLESRRLVLIGADNQVFDLLSPEQQQQLQRRIVWEIAHLYRERRALQEAKLALRVPSDAADDERVFLPARWFWRAMGWMQRSSVAMAIDLFQESALVAPPVAAVPVPPPTLLGPLPEERKPLALVSFLEPIDRTLADFEVQWGEHEIVRAIADTPVPVAWLEEMNISLPHPKAVATPERATDSEVWTIQTLLRAAIDYFFGPRDRPSGLETTSQSAPLPPNPRARQPRLAESSPLPLHADLEADLWLSWDDLYGEGADDGTSAENPSNFSVPARLAAAPPTPRLKETPPRKNPSRLRPIPQPDEKDLVRLASEVNRDRYRRSSPLQARSRNLENLSQAEDVAEDWLEVEATPTGYVKHPLEQILEWLDRFMLAVEEFLLSIWRWLYRQIP